MRIITGLSIAALAISAISAPAFGKAHSKPASSADFGQSNASGQFDEPNNLDARGLLDDFGFQAEDPKGVEGGETSTDARTKDKSTTPAKPRS
jgi:hypothetical protein